MGDSSEWVSWDHAFAYALQTIEDFTDQNGLLHWEKEDEAVEIDAEKRIDKYRASVERATAGTKNKPYKASPGEYFVPKMWSRASGGHIQTYQEWHESRIREAIEQARQVE